MQKGPAILIILVALIALGYFSFTQWKKYHPAAPPAGANQMMPGGMPLPPGMTPPGAPAPTPAP